MEEERRAPRGVSITDELPTTSSPPERRKVRATWLPTPQLGSSPRPSWSSAPARASTLSYWSRYTFWNDG
jgi:hypothetical protein